MTDFFGPWRMMQEQVQHMQQTALDAAFKAMGSGDQFDNAARAAKEIADMQAKAWERWMSMWGVEKK